MDAICEDLARIYLGDSDLTPVQQDALRPKLAKTIQDTIEEFLRFELHNPLDKVSDL